ncbi:MAG: hypothetical protein IH965_12065 [Gemmatimonadetes bacterium]|nr:hypothetical protein [Gemmatimonadota bacterium]
MIERVLLSLTVGAALMAAVCNSVLAPELTGFVVLAQGGDVDSITPLILTPRRGEIEITVSMRTPCDSYTAAGTLSQTADTLSLAVLGSFAGQCPFDVVGNLIYRATIREVPPGNYRLRVVHEWSEGGWVPETAVDRTVTVY